MFEYAFDFLLVAVLVIGITALMGVITNGIGETIFSGKKKNENVEHTLKTQAGWRKVGGRRS
ncbi:MULTISPECIES: hypothetical protein [Metabacillus]|uniref:Uncharacterized protein n=1 Tax=Metabacillus hrfriensis TaxID=3048891 RepID=A0ACD4REE5_9BACI|nr:MULTISPECIES: hypothetical protein [Metabacillus]UOK58840.1 hypothetical protein MGI18_07245 [Bacillus sp. OVS6]USK29646.1 hypothetical protein LIT32_05910 [Bacillus sp. CMF21]WHZ58890.1 hypothetical protein QLQ22_06005 [Metabacillus sp. CT-WN-B3]